MVGLGQEREGKYIWEIMPNARLALGLQCPYITQYSKYLKYFKRLKEVEGLVSQKLIDCVD